MSERAAFVRAIRENLADDAPRLIAADWFEEHGQETRAEFIRVQVEAASLSPYEQRSVKLAARAKELERQHEKSWQPTLTDLVANRAYRRGFVERATVTAEHFITKHQTLFEWEPLNELILSQYDSRLAQLVACPGLLNLHGLDLTSSGLASRQSQAFFNSRYLHQLRKLDVSGNWLGAIGVRAIFNARMDNLNELVMTTALSQVREAKVFGSERLRNLKKLNLAQNNLPQVSLNSLLQACFWPTLGTLDLSENPVGEHLHELFCAKSSNLRELALAHCLLGDTGLERTFAPQRFCHLEKLNLSGNPVTPGIWGLLADPTRFPSLKNVALLLSEPDFFFGSPFSLEDIAGIRLFAESKVMANLTSLKTGATEPWLEVLTNTENAKKLESLTLTHPTNRDDLLREFGKKAQLPALRELMIYFDNPITRFSLKTFLTSGRFPKLVRVSGTV